jgi:galactokinase
MATARHLRRIIEAGGAREVFELLYGRGPGMAEAAAGRYLRLLDRFLSTFSGDAEAVFFSAPGRTEIGGNHTDHNHGRVLAAAVDLDAIAVAARSDDGRAVVESEGYPRQEVDLDRLHPVEAEKGTPAAVVRGVCARMRANGHGIGGFQACVASRVPMGSGLSSSAAFEVLVGTVLNGLYNGGRVPDVEIARIGQWAENRYFGKPCGLMDQTASAVGGFVAIDFRDPERAQVRKVDFDFNSSGHALVIVDTGGSHADLTGEYAAIPEEMRSVARELGGSVLRDVSREAVTAAIPALRARLGDRAVLRALHFFDDDRRAAEEAAALERGDFAQFLRLVNDSGVSSAILLQNVWRAGSPREQGVSLALAVSRDALGGRGACRVHGGGFAGTIQAFVPEDLLESFLGAMRRVFGESSCLRAAVRAAGAARVEIA